MPARPSVPPRRRWSRRQRTTVALGVLALAALLVALTYAGARAARDGGLVVVIEAFFHRWSSAPRSCCCSSWRS
ncbi:hypothetical protein ACWEQL_28015 [Kitasatospora sp. NPDC004240]